MLTVPKERAPRNRTIALTVSEQESYAGQLIKLSHSVTTSQITDKTANQDMQSVTPFLPEAFVDLLFIDPPYNLNKTFNSNSFKSLSSNDYLRWMESWFIPLLPTLKKSASIYICGDWRSSSAIQLFAEKHLKIQNRITWEREKGRGAKSNWKNCSEDIWFCTVSDDYFFDADAVKLKRKVIAPYKENGQPKDWEETDAGGFRQTSPSNIWTDLTVPFWSMPENTDHPTQKPEKLLAKIILASSRPGDFVFDPFLGSGTTSVVAKKLGRHFFGVEQDYDFACLAEKRLQLANNNCAIQGYADGIFWERNSLALQPRQTSKNKETKDTLMLHFSE